MSWLAGEATTAAFCWRLDRRDGVTIGFTSHDRDLVLGGLVFRAAPGVTPSAVTRTEGLEAATLEVAGALTSDAITEGDLAAGRWDGAGVRLWAVDWTAPDDAPLLLARGEVGDVASTGAGFTAELVGPAAALDRPAAPATSPECRASLGDRRCGVDLRGRERRVRVVAADGVELRVDLVEPIENAFAGGRLWWVDGANGGLVTGVAGSAGDVIELAEPPPFAVEVGARVVLVEGCDRRLETCAGRFGNAANFRGEPHLPGNDLLTRYPGA